MIMLAMTANCKLQDNEETNTTNISIYIL